MAFQIPEDLTSLSDDELAAAQEDARKSFADIAKTKDEDLTDEQIAEMQALADFTDGAAAQISDREVKRQERAEGLAKMRERMDPKKDEQEKVSKEDAPADLPADLPADAPAEPEVPVDEPAPVDEPINIPADPDVIVEPAEGIEDTEADQAEEDEKKKEHSAVTASAKPSIADLAGKAPEVTPQDAAPSAVSITASADLGNIPTGKSYASMSEAGEAILASAKSLPSGMAGRASKRALQISRDREFSQKDFRDDNLLMDALGKAAGPTGTTAEGLVAAGGWAAPSDVSLDFCDIERPEGLIDIPEFTVVHGGVKYLKTPTLESVLKSATGFWDQTETVAEAGTELKTSLRPKMTGFEEERLDAVGTMGEAGLLTRAGFPELVERYAALALIAHEIKKHKKTVGLIETKAGTATTTLGPWGNALDIIAGLEIAAKGERQRYVLPDSSTIEVLLPAWLKSLLILDFANRAGINPADVKEAQFDALFTERNLRVQWINYWQDITVPAAPKVVTEIPKTVNAVIYPAGAFTRGHADVLTLDTVYDSVNLKKNDYVHLFVEEGILVANKCYDGRKVTLPVTITGRTGASDITKALGNTVTP